MTSQDTAPAPTGTESSPWQGRAACLLLAAVAVYYGVMFLLNVCGYFDVREFAISDTTFFRHFGRRMAEGASLYTDLWDTKGPMVYLTYYWGSLWDLEAAILLYSLAACALAYRAFRSVGAPVAAALGVVVMSQTTGFIGWCGTSTESTYALWVLAGLAVLLPAEGGGRWGWRWMFCGAMTALCVLSKVNYVGFGCFLLAYWACRRCFWRATLASAVGFCVVLGGFALTMWGNGNLAAMVDATVMFNLHEYHAAAPDWAQFPSLPSPLGGLLTLAGAEFQYAKHFLRTCPALALLLAASAAISWRKRRETTAKNALAIAAGVWVLAEFLTGGVKFLIYDHYYTTLIPPVCLLAVLAVGALHRTAPRGVMLALMVATAVFESGPWGAFRPLGGTPEAAGQTLARQDALLAGLNPQHRPVAVLGGTNVLHALNRSGLSSNQRYLHNAWMLDYELSPARRSELLAELESALAEAPLLISEEPLPSLISRHPDLAPLLHGWHPVEGNGGGRVFLYRPMPRTND